MPKEFLTRHEAAAVLGISVPTLDRYQRDKKIKAYRKVGSTKNWYNPDELADLLGYHAVEDDES